jgi:hypothetical protein
VPFIMTVAWNGSVHRLASTPVPDSDGPGAYQRGAGGIDLDGLHVVSTGRIAREGDHRFAEVRFADSLPGVGIVGLALWSGGEVHLWRWDGHSPLDRCVAVLHGRAGRFRRVDDDLWARVVTMRFEGEPGIVWTGRRVTGRNGPTDRVGHIVYAELATGERLWLRAVEQRSDGQLVYEVVATHEMPPERERVVDYVETLWPSESTPPVGEPIELRFGDDLIEAHVVEYAWDQPRPVAVLHIRSRRDLGTC